MELDDLFSVPELEVFGLDVDGLVIPTYEAAIAGIEALDKKKRAELKERGQADPTSSPELWFWEIQIQEMTTHAGNMGLVSLLALFDHYLSRQQPNGNWKSWFERLADTLGAKGPLSLGELQEMVDARNSVIHHNGKREFLDDRQKLRTVSDRFLNFDIGLDGQVGIEKELLVAVANKLKLQVEYWNRKKRDIKRAAGG